MNSLLLCLNQVVYNSDMTPIPCRLNAMPYDSRVPKPIKNIIVYSREASSQKSNYRMRTLYHQTWKFIKG
ncbi:hypothetical protein NMY3_01753 [Candidatus Nitrosocosmicus oleophilus]|uniref:Uncharacterized protein n=1 Tax=Candidatus Nitrosocosmicus oleophilus TaxID=1353260 RepID=A0A654LZT9_9ARCH|nr:hypothetical protein NMY3_01753 [Candidatus Nitrosocosmicus oleophilus]